MSDNLTLTAFIDDNAYVTLLYSCDLIVDLTTREDCLVCGAYESVSAEKPLLLSDTTALRVFW